MRVLALALVNFIALSAAYGDQVDGSGKLEDPLSFLFQKRGMPSMADLEAAENSMSLSLYSCEVQKSVLARLRDLVIMSISQVKTCMAQRDAEKKSNKYAYFVKSSDTPVKSIREFDNRLLTI